MVLKRTRSGDDTRDPRHKPLAFGLSQRLPVQPAALGRSTQLTANQREQMTLLLAPFAAHVTNQRQRTSYVPLRHHRHDHIWLVDAFGSQTTWIRDTHHALATTSHFIDQFGWQPGRIHLCPIRPHHNALAHLGFGGYFAHLHGADGEQPRDQPCRSTNPLVVFPRLTQRKRDSIHDRQ